MPTQKPLSELIPDILAHIENKNSTLEYNYRLYKANEGQIKVEIEDSMRQEILSPQALRRALQRIPSINILKKANDKISTVYAEPVKRTVSNITDQSIINNIAKYSRLDVAMMHADSMANLQKMAAVEPYFQNGIMYFRVLGGHQFIPFSDDPLNPLNMTVFIKLAGKRQREYVMEEVNASSGVYSKSPQVEIKNVDTYILYSDSEVLAIDSTGKIMTDVMKELGINGKNEFGVIPQTYINKSHFELVPFPDTSGLDTAILIPKLLTDLNYAVQYMSHSILWTKNADLGNQELNPDVVINLGEGTDNGAQPEIGSINPQVDIAGVLQMIEFELNGYLSSIGIKTTSLNGLKSGREVSGVAKAIDEGDVSMVRRKNLEFFKEIEQKLWNKITQIQNTASSLGLVNKEARKFSSKAMEDFSIIFGEVKILESVNDKVAKLRFMNEMGIISKFRMLKEFMPDLTEAQLNDLIKESQDEKLKEMEAQMELMSDGSSTEDNNNDTTDIQPDTQKPDSE